MTRIFLAALGTALVAAAQQPQISNANFQNASAAGGLEQAVRAAIAKQSGPAWIGYAVAKIPGDSQSCCWKRRRARLWARGQSHRERAGGTHRPGAA
jgi:hypothetical protein